VIAVGLLTERAFDRLDISVARNAKRLVVVTADGHDGPPQLRANQLSKLRALNPG
jgi:hypothetical protein